MATPVRTPTQRPLKIWVAFVVATTVILIALMALFGRTRDFSGRRYTGPPDDAITKFRILRTQDRSQYRGR